ncbi:MAG: hypothetical protein JW727_06905 [Candidatus Aenigmarchaeota archaeon]|nr:hypothetical protein [Candidatus Aenigmarchaeota archaeon]
MEADLSGRAREIIKSCEICDECLGRQFHALNPKLPNFEIGRAIRNFIILEDAAREKPAEYKKVENCCLCKNLFREVETYSEMVAEAVKEFDYETFLVGSILPPELFTIEEEFWEEHGVGSCESIKSNFNRSVGLKVREKTGKKIEFDGPDMTAIIDIPNGKIIAQVSPLYIKGGYKKLLPKGKVQKYIEGTFLEKSGAREAVFYSVGRLEENTLTAAYRPFVLMLRTPKVRKLKLGKIRSEINQRKSISVSKMSFSSKEELDAMKSDKIAANFLITLKFEPLSEEEKKEAIKAIRALRKKRVVQILKQKTRRPYMRKISPKFEGDKMLLEVETTVGFSVNSFLTGKSRPNLEGILGKPFEVESIVLRRFKTMKPKDLY